jgi:hypothetical protein
MPRILSQRQFAALGRIARKKLVAAKAALKSNDLPAAQAAIADLKTMATAVESDAVLAKTIAEKLQIKLDKLKR